MRFLKKRLSVAYYSVPPLRAILPSVMTLISLCSGIVAIFQAFESRWEPAALLILLSMLLDGLDGRMARLLRVSSAFGAELDSLADLTAFGLAPGFVMFFWSLTDMNRYGWFPVLLLAVCAAIRLARFNVALLEEKEPWRRLFFSGCPSPTGAVFAIVPLVLWLALQDSSLSRHEVWFTYLRSPIFAFISVCFAALAMVSTIPMYSFKKLPRFLRNFWTLLILCAVFFVLAFMKTWLVVAFYALVYIITVPFSIRRYFLFKKEDLLLKETLNKIS